MTDYKKDIHVEKDDFYAEFDSHNTFYSKRFGGVLIAIKYNRPKWLNEKQLARLKRYEYFNKNNLILSWKKDGFELIPDIVPSANIKTFVDAGYRVLHSCEAGAHYYSLDGN